MASDGKLEGALAAYGAALDLAPGVGEHILHSNAAAACLQLGRHEEALQHALAAVELAPVGFTNAPIRLIHAYYALGRFSEAAEACQAALERHPGFKDVPEYKVGRGWACLIGRGWAAQLCARFVMLCYVEPPPPPPLHRSSLPRWPSRRRLSAGGGEACERSGNAPSVTASALHKCTT